MIHWFRDESLLDGHPAPIDKIAIFDEAQRAWKKEQLSKFMRTKKGQAHFNMSEPECLRTPNKTEKRSKRQQGRKKPNGYQPCVHIGRAGACIDGTRQRFAQQPSGAFQDERNCPPHVWQCGALYVSLCTPVCKTENRTLYQREVSEDDKWVSRANFAGMADDPAYIPAFCNHSHWRQ